MGVSVTAKYAWIIGQAMAEGTARTSSGAPFTNSVDNFVDNFDGWIDSEHTGTDAVA
jgi:hypothetical protein